ncbi:MAG TPA: hypothetical protein PLW48_11630, partial [Alphaproteobacteria bacterium]|nr:hypothetical protein [Alphaproteobacteria bacterium]
CIFCLNRESDFFIKVLHTLYYRRLSGEPLKVLRTFFSSRGLRFFRGRIFLSAVLFSAARRGRTDAS